MLTSIGASSSVNFDRSQLKLTKVLIGAHQFENQSLIDTILIERATL